MQHISLLGLYRNSWYVELFTASCVVRNGFAIGCFAGTLPLVSLRKTHCDRNFTYGQSVGSVMVAAMPPTQSTMTYSHDGRMSRTRRGVSVTQDLESGRVTQQI